MLSIQYTIVRSRGHINWPFCEKRFYNKKGRDLVGWGSASKFLNLGPQREHFGRKKWRDGKGKREPCMMTFVQFYLLLKTP